VSRSAPPIVILPIVEWGFRRQRPQHLASCFARAGWRVYYVELRLACAPAPPRLVTSGIWQLALSGDPAIDLYRSPLSQRDVAVALGSLQRLSASGHSLDGCWVVTQLPAWGALASAARDAFRGALLFDCMDDFAAFGNHADLSNEERSLAARADLVTVSAAALHARLARQAKRCVVIANGCDPEHFGPAMARDRPSDRPIIGYFGGIHDWFDSELVAALARRNPEWDFWLVGDVYRGDVEELRRLHNVRLWGEVPYSELPRVVSWFDVGLIPFKRYRLTEATNPVKVYEMLAAGLPVVAVDIPELRALQPLVAVGEGPDELEQLLAAAVVEPADRRGLRREHALANSWTSRFLTLREAMVEAAPQLESGKGWRSVADEVGAALFDPAIESQRERACTVDLERECARLQAQSESLIEQRDRVMAEVARLSGELARVEVARLAGERELQTLHEMRPPRLMTALRRFAGQRR
jgi:glycosyltransferase involved in cell wall biosynthesis